MKINSVFYDSSLKLSKQKIESPKYLFVPHKAIVGVLHNVEKAATSRKFC